MKKALVLMALFLAPLLPLAEAAGPEPRTWSPYAAQSDVGSLAMARDGKTIVAGLVAPAVTPTPGATPQLPNTQTASRADVAVLDHDYGFATNFTVNRFAGGGTTIVSVSRDGGAFAALRRDAQIDATQPPGASASITKVQLQYGRIPTAGNWTNGPSYQRVIDLGLATVTTPVAVAVSANGDRVVALVLDGTDHVIRGYSATGSSLDPAFEIRAAGTARALATSGDLTRLAIAGQFVVGNFTYGGVQLRQFAQAEPVATYYDNSANNTDARGVQLSRDASTLALGGGDGRLHVFHGARDALVNPGTLSLGSGGLGNLTLSDDGTRLVSALGNAVTALDVSGAPRVLWNTTSSGQNVTGLAMNRTGGLIIVGSGGTGGAVQAFSDVDSTVLWAVPGDTRAVAVDADGTRVAYAQRSAVGATRIPRALVMELVGGGKVAPTQTVTVPGTTTVSVNLRNDGAALERVVFEEGAPEVSVTTDPAVINVRPGTIQRVNVTVDILPGLLGQRVFNLTARSLTSGVLDNVTLSVTPRPTLDVKLAINATDVLAQAGQTHEILVTIVNNGTGDAPVVLRGSQVVSSGALWNVSLSESSLTALRGTRTSVKVLVTPPAAAANGTSAVITLTLEGQDIFDSKTVSFRINPELKVEVNATAVTKFIEPGRKASYNVTVTNIGSLPRQFDVFYTIVASDGRNWGVDMRSELVRLEPNAKRTFPVSIVAPADALPQERVAVLVSARSIAELPNETVVEHNVTLYGIAVEPKITTTTTPANGIPAVAPLASVALVALVAAFVSRRRKP